MITPLLALIEDQVENFNKRHLCYRAVYPDMDNLSLQKLFAKIQHSQADSDRKCKIQYKLLYLSPERLCSQRFLRELDRAEEQGLRIDHIVIDEVHCMSQWGFDFRESYLHIAKFIEQRPVRPIISTFTATAAPRDIAEIKRLLRLPKAKEMNEISYLEERKNLLFHVIPCSGSNGTQDDPPQTRLDTLIRILEKNDKKACLIYRTTVSGVDELYDKLKKNEVMKDRLVKYHGKMPSSEKESTKELFLDSSGECGNILIATSAFGMGIDKDDISCVIHYDVPRSLEEYYQETGRAGRDAEKVPQANCYLLYADGPSNEKGTLQYTLNWVISGRKQNTSGPGPIFSQFSAEMKENIYFWSYYRLCYVRKYCNEAILYPQKAQTFIVNYLKYDVSAGPNVIDQIAADLDSFYDYALKRTFHNKDLFKGSSIAGFFDACPEEGQQKPDKLHTELKQLIDSVNEIYINNTHAANFLRDHADEYRLNCPFKPGNDLDSEQFTIYGNEKVSYFDMCVLDAVYTIELFRKKQVSIKAVWEILTGRDQKYSSAQKREAETRIRHSIEKMRGMHISIIDRQSHFEKRHEVFLPLKKPEGQKGYSYSAIPPLYEFAEKKNYQFIKVPVLLFSTAKIIKSGLWKDDFSTTFRHDGEDKITIGPGKSNIFEQRVKCLPQDIKHEPKIRKLTGEKYKELECIRKQTYSFTPAINHFLLCHYLIRRIEINKKTGLKEINFTRIKEITQIRENSCLFQKKTAAVLDHYQKIGFLDQYHLYKMLDSRVYGSAGRAYFRIKTDPVIKYWRCHDMYYLFMSDFETAVEEKFLNHKMYTEEAKRKLAAMPFGSFDGIRLKQKKPVSGF